MAADGQVGVLGTVAWYEPGKGHGFATPDGGGPEVFVHSSAIVTGGVVCAARRTRAGRPSPGEVRARSGEGVVARYDVARGFGFISPDAGGPDFVHMSVLVDAEPLRKGARVRHRIRQSDRGPQADRVERV